MKILLIAGHGAGDPGAVANGYSEAELTREVAALLKPEISRFAEVDVFDTKRDMYRYIASGGAYDFEPYDYVLEVHFNSGARDYAGNRISTGVEIYVTNAEAKTTAEEKIVANIAKLGFKNRGVKRRDWTVIRRVKSQGVSAALLEVCFVDDKDDMELYEKYKKQIAKAVANGIAEGYGIAAENENPEGNTMTNAEFKAMYENLMANDYGAREPQEWSAEARAWAEANKIVQGDENGWMHYESPVTRQEVVQMLYNFWNLLQITKEE